MTSFNFAKPLFKERKNIQQLSFKLFQLTPGSSTEDYFWEVTKYLKIPIAEVPSIKRQNGILARNNSYIPNTLHKILKKDFIKIQALGISSQRASAASYC
jgi:hypothetical protein